MYVLFSVLFLQSVSFLFLDQFWKSSGQYFFKYSLCLILPLRELHYVPVRLLNRRRQWHPTPVLLPGKSHGQRSLVGCSPRDHKELDTTRLNTHALGTMRKREKTCISLKLKLLQKRTS